MVYHRQSQGNWSINNRGRLFFGAIGVIGYICNWSEQKIKKLGGYPEDDKQIPWYKPAPSSIVLFFIILISILFYFAFKYMTR